MWKYDNSPSSSETQVINSHLCELENEKKKSKIMFSHINRLWALLNIS